MKRGWVLFPLAERGAFPAGALMVLMAVSYPVMAFLDVDLANAPKAGGTPIPVLYLLWRETLSFPGAVGMLAGICVTQLRGASFAWSLPHVDRRLRFDVFILMSVVAMVMVLFHLAIDGTVIAAFGLAALAFATGFTLNNIASPRGTRWLALLLLVLAIKADLLLSLMMASPAVTGVMATALSVTLTLFITSRTARRIRADRLGQPLGFWAQRTLDRLMPTKVIHGPRLKTGSIFEWVNLTRDQRALGQLRITVGHLLHAALMGTLGFILMNGMFAIVMFLINDSATSVRGPAGPFVYPISRKKRAAVCVVGNLMSAITYCVGISVVVAILNRWAPFIHVNFFTSDVLAQSQIIPLCAALLIFLPFAQWSKTQPPVRPLIERKPLEGWNPLNIGLGLIAIIGMVGGGLGLADFRRAVPGVVFYPMAITLIIISNYIYLRLLQRSFMTKDLV